MIHNRSAGGARNTARGQGVFERTVPVQQTDVPLRAERHRCRLRFATGLMPWSPMLAARSMLTTAPEPLRYSPWQNNKVKPTQHKLDEIDRSIYRLYGAP
ncbi:hypothetical protein [Microbacterium sp. NPDC058389]|uniref:hypothetical protein n=1 Tax=Microbacterium sp. NPDC058389 TaxID=3346475 RepID=UPI00365BCDBE